VIKTETEIQNAYVSSVGGAIGGLALFGPLGAMVGGRTKKKTDKIIHNYLIFAYDKDGQTDFISFDVTNRLITARRFVSAFSHLLKEEQEIEL